MLASITPLGERGRNSTWAITVTAFLLGATLAGAAAGGALGTLGGLLRLSASTRLAVLLVALAASIALDIIRRPVPGPRRQVNERWLGQYRGWVYGAGFGAQLGMGLTTVVMSAATYVAVLSALLAGGAVAGALVLGCFGLVRGIQPLFAGGVRTQGRLVALHQGLSRWRDRVRWGAVGLQATLALAVALVLAGA